jgi:hypothetical protein
VEVKHLEMFREFTPATGGRTMPSKVVELDIEELHANLNQIEQAMGEPTSRPFRTLLDAYVSLMQLIQEKNISIDRLRRMLFGARTERTRQPAGTGTGNASQNGPSGQDGH